MNEKIFTNFKPESTFCHNVDLYHHALTHEVHFDVAPPTCPTIPMERHHHKSSKIPSQFVKKKKYIKKTHPSWQFQFSDTKGGDKK